MRQDAKEVLHLLQVCEKGWLERGDDSPYLTDVELLDFAAFMETKQKRSGIQTRRNELVKAGMLRHTGYRHHGGPRAHKTWGLTDRGRNEPVS